MDKNSIIPSIFAAIISGVIVFTSASSNDISNEISGVRKTNSEPKLAYRVYLEGKSLGLIKSKNELENYIDKEQSIIKEKYNVSKVFVPNDLDIKREYTYKENLSSAKQIYSEIKSIKGIESFTIDGFKITIDGVDETTEKGTIKGEDQVLYVLDRKIFEESAQKTITSFVDQEEYQTFMDNAQEEIKDTGKIIEDLYIKNTIKITKEKIPTGAQIFTDVETLSKYLLFGTTSNLDTYTVKSGDTIEKISNDNKMSPEEFLIANTSFNSTEALLFEGEKVTVGLIKPQFKVVEEDYKVEKQVVTYNTIYESDPEQYIGYEKVKQEGQDGLQKVTSIVQLENGEIIGTKILGTPEVLKPTIDRIIIRGTKIYKYDNSSADGEAPPLGQWVFPTEKPFTINSPYGWRWGKLHGGIDIGKGYGTAIYAANNGLVTKSGYNDINGHFVVLKHGNNYYTMYGHMATRTVRAGQTVYAGDKIGTMGDSGFATGTHLHFGLYIGNPYGVGYRTINPNTFLRY